ncbi:MAG: hypothetical protein M3297_08670 [Thermoproteota archaeon]|nr:hypothetical protein [Thermoproteota archaeon]
MLIKCVECDHIFGDDEAEYIYRGKTYCDDCYRAVRKAEAAAQQEESKS